MKDIKPSAIFNILEKVASRKNKGLEISVLAAGEPDFDTPDYIKEAAIKAIKEGKTKYTPVSGIPELRLAVVDIIKKTKGLNYSPGQVLVSSGAKQSIFNILFSIVEEDDEVIILIPYWVSYPEMVRLAGGKPIFVPPSKNFNLNLEEIKRRITPKTKAIMLNSPNNPTGVVYTEKEMKELADLTKERDIFIISDEIYDKLIYDNTKTFSMAEIPQMREKTFIINGVSKTFAMTGWRIGWAVGPKKYIDNAKSIQSHTTSCPSSISQYAALAALTVNSTTTEEMRATFEKRRNLMIKLLREIPGLSFPYPRGAFYVFVNVSRYDSDSVHFCNILIDNGLSVIPGVSFGIDGYIRISYASSFSEIENGLGHLRDYINSR